MNCRGYVMSGALFALICAIPSRAPATITQGDLSISGNFMSREAGRFGEASDRNESLMASGAMAGRSGGPYALDRWDLVEARQIATFRPDYRLIKNYKLLDRLDNLPIKDADVFMAYQGWYDAFGDLKAKGTAPPGYDWPRYTQQNRIDRFTRNELREYWVQLDVTEALSFRIGQQQIIWSEADALSGTEVTNALDLSYHWIHFETPEDLRRNVRMIKMNYEIGDFWKLANNTLEGFWIPGDFAFYKFSVDARDPYVLPARQRIEQPLTNQEGVVRNFGTVHELAAYGGAPMADVGQTFSPQLSPFIGANGNGKIFADVNLPLDWKTPGSSIRNSELGVRYSTLIPIGNGLQASFIYEWVFRSLKAAIDPFGPAPPCIAAGTCTEIVGPDLPGNNFSKGGVHTSGGFFLTVNTSGCNSTWKTRRGGLPVRSVSPGSACAGPPPGRYGELWTDSSLQLRRANFFGLTGTYYDKDLTDIVFRYDFAYRSHYGYVHATSTKGFGAMGSLPLDPGSNEGAWTDEAIGIIAFDRPTYIPWISKQHTFFVSQWVTNWFINAHEHQEPYYGARLGKLRKFQNVAFVAAVDWLLDGRLTTTNAFFWDIDDKAGFFLSNNAYRYRRNVLLNLNLQWYQGATWRNTDPFAQSNSQRMSELEFMLTYEI